MLKTADRPPRAAIYRSEIDGAWVVHIDTDPDGPEDTKGPEGLRIYVNDGDPAVYSN